MTKHISLVSSTKLDEFSGYLTAYGFCIVNLIHGLIIDKNKLDLSMLIIKSSNIERSMICFKPCFFHAFFDLLKDIYVLCNA